MALNKHRLRAAVERARASATRPGARHGAWPWFVVVILLIPVAWYAGRLSGIEEGSGRMPQPASGPRPVPRPSPPATMTPEAVAERVRALRHRVVAANLPSVEVALATASETTDRNQIVRFARQAGRAFDFPAWRINRDRATARRLHDPMRRVLNVWPPSPAETCDPLEGAFLQDPVDAEVSGNLAICLVRARDGERAKAQAVYSLSLPKGSTSTGRTADWVTLAAAYATLGDSKRAREALFVALTTVDDPVKRCLSAKYALQHTLGPVLRPATEAMFARIRELRMTDSAECTLPVQ